MANKNESNNDPQTVSDPQATPLEWRQVLAVPLHQHTGVVALAGWEPAQVITQKEYQQALKRFLDTPIR